MNREKAYDHHLRVIGQALEAKGIDVFELEHRGDRYIVNGKPARTPSLIAKLRDWRERMLGESTASSIIYSRADIERLEREGRAKRRKADRLPDFYSLSNTMRTLGFYLDSKDAELLRIQKRALTVTLLYQSKDGHPEVEEQSIASFYNLFLSLYDKRRKAAQG
ncbi:MAG TPA: hypothetical protein VFU31_28580 [Candidatus Binatia bacterium]|nr:hypothetical protein [Candidatus Binatia bacterium]